MFSKHQNKQQMIRCDSQSIRLHSLKINRKQYLAKNKTKQNGQTQVPCDKVLNCFKRSINTTSKDPAVLDCVDCGKKRRRRGKTEIWKREQLWIVRPDDNCTAVCWPREEGHVGDTCGKDKLLLLFQTMATWKERKQVEGSGLDQNSFLSAWSRIHNRTAQERWSWFRFIDFFELDESGGYVGPLLHD